MLTPTLRFLVFNFLFVFVPACTDAINVVVGFDSAEIAILHFCLVIILWGAHLQNEDIDIPKPYIWVFAILFSQSAGIIHMTSSCIVSCKDKIDAFICIGDEGIVRVQFADIFCCTTNVGLWLENFGQYHSHLGSKVDS